jgi:hypothetical protein
MVFESDNRIFQRVEERLGVAFDFDESRRAAKNRPTHKRSSEDRTSAFTTRRAISLSVIVAKVFNGGPPEEEDDTADDGYEDEDEQD